MRAEEARGRDVAERAFIARYSGVLLLLLLLLFLEAIIIIRRRFWRSRLCVRLRRAKPPRRGLSLPLLSREEKK